MPPVPRRMQSKHKLRFMSKFRPQLMAVFFFRFTERKKINLPPMAA